MNSPLYNLGKVFLAAFAIVALALGYWGITARDDLLTRQDNPRNVLAEQQIQRGQILDRNGVVLAETHISSDGIAARRYPYPQTASVVGYYSLRYGVGGIEAEYDPALRGTQFLSPSQSLLDRTLHRPLVGGDVRLTLDLAVQKTTALALEKQQGAAVVLDAVTGDVLALVSAPSFDPNTLDAHWDTLSTDPASPLLNRATQGLYQPGTGFLPITLGEALNTSIASLDEPWNGELEAEVDTSVLPCAGSRIVPGARLEDAFVWGCPAPFPSIGLALGAQGLTAAFDDFGLQEAPAFNLPTAISQPGSSTLDPALTAIGQGGLTITPLRMALVAAAFADHGQMPAPRLVSAVRAPGGEWTITPTQGNPRGTISAAHADEVVTLMRLAVTTGAAESAYADGYDIAAYCGLAISGPQHAFSTWFIGFVTPKGKNSIALAVLLENRQDCGAAAGAGRDILVAAAGGA